MLHPSESVTPGAEIPLIESPAPADAAFPDRSALLTESPEVVAVVPSPERSPAPRSIESPEATSGVEMLPDLNSGSELAVVLAQVGEEVGLPEEDAAEPVGKDAPAEELIPLAEGEAAGASADEKSDAEVPTVSIPAPEAAVEPSGTPEWETEADCDGALDVEVEPSASIGSGLRAAEAGQSIFGGDDPTAVAVNSPAAALVESFSEAEETPLEDGIPPVAGGKLDAEVGKLDAEGEGLVSEVGEGSPGELVSPEARTVAAADEKPPQSWLGALKRWLERRRHR